NVKRVLTGKDPVTGDKANRLLALGGLALDLATYAFPIAKLGKVGKVATAAKTIDTVDDVSDATRAYSASKGLKTADAIDDVGDAGRLIDKIASQSVTADDIIYSDKFKKGDYVNQVSRRGWDNQMIADTINNPVKTTKGYNSYTNSSVTNYYIDDIHYVAVDDSNGKVIQIADLGDSGWRGPE
ncbi:colicin E5-related ribonuclease, partial [Streptococcus cuniculi]